MSDPRVVLEQAMSLVASRRRLCERAAEACDGATVAGGREWAERWRWAARTLAELDRELFAMPLPNAVEKT